VNFSKLSPEVFAEDFPEALILEDGEGRVLDVNATACQLLGYEKNELLGLKVKDLINSSEPIVLPEPIDKSPSPSYLEATVLARDGTEVPVELRTRPVDVERGKAKLVCLNDRSTRKETVNQLNQYRTGIEASYDLIAACDENYSYLFTNKAYRDFFQLKKEGVANGKIEDLIGKSKFEVEVKPELEKCLAGERVEREVAFNQPEKGEKYFETVFYPLRVDSKVQGAVVVMRDVTRQKAAESKLKTYLDSSPYGLLMVDDRRSILEVNDVACRLTGYGRSEMLDMTMLELFESESPKAIEENFRRLKETGRVEAELTYRRKDGTKRNWSVSAIKLSEGKYLGFVEDITKRKKTELALLGERNKLRRLHATVDRLQQMVDEESILDAAVEAAVDLLEFEACAVKLVETDSLVTEATSPNLRGEKIERFKSVESLTEKTFLKGRTIWGEDFRDFSDEETAREDLRAYISVPIGEIGVILGFSPETRRYETQDVELAEILAGHLREELKRIRLEEALRQKANSTESTKIKLEKLHDIAGKLESAGGKDDIYHFAVKAAVDILGFSACNLDMAEENSIVTKATAGELYPDGSEPEAIDIKLSDKTYRTGKTYVHGDLREIEGAGSDNTTYRSVISTPVGDLGAFQLASDRVGAFSDEDVRLVKLLSKHVYEGLRRIELEKKLRNQAICDPLTGLYNRRYFTESLEKEIERSKRYGHDITFIMFDVNRFKEINDLYSHQTGDKVLQTVATLIRNNVRNADTVVRYGGDEFLVMMPETSGNTENTVNRIRRKLIQWHDESDLLDFRFTLAVGFARWNPFGGIKIEDTLREADRKMYEDKRR